MFSIVLPNIQERKEVFDLGQDSVPEWAVDTVGALVPQEPHENNLDQIGHLTVSKDGQRLYLTQPTRNQIWILTRAGARVSALGRTGEGPGEFQGLGPIGWTGDTLWATDRRSGRLTLFYGDTLRTVQFRLPGGQSEETLVRPFAVLEDNSILATSGAYSSRVAKNRGIRLPLLQLTEEGELIDTLAVVTQRNRTLAVRMGETQIYWNQPFSDADLWDVSPRGAYLAIVERGSSVDSYALRILSALGDTIGSSVISIEAIQLTAERIEARLRPILARARRRPWYSGRFPGRYREALFIPDHCLPATDMLVTDDGSVWVRREDCENTPLVQWDVFDQSARLRGRLRLPSRARVLHATDSSLWIMSATSLGLPQIHELSILK